MSASRPSGAVSATRPARRSVGGSSGGWNRPNTRLVAQSAHPHLGRLSLRGDALHHLIRWNLDFPIPPALGGTSGRDTCCPLTRPLGSRRARCPKKSSIGGHGGSQEKVRVACGWAGGGMGRGAPSAGGPMPQSWGRARGGPASSYNAFCLSPHSSSCDRLRAPFKLIGFLYVPSHYPQEIGITSQIVPALRFSLQSALIVLLSSIHVFANCLKKGRIASEGIPRARTGFECALIVLLGFVHVIPDVR